MARKTKYDRLVYHDALEAITNAKQKILETKKIDADSVPSGYISGYRISIVDNTDQSDNVNYSFYAALDGGVTLDTDRIIGHWTSGPGGGTGWLPINRRIWHNEDGEVGGPITVWAESSQTTDSVTITITQFSQRLTRAKV